jgi:hypothetical protein
MKGRRRAGEDRCDGNRDTFARNEILAMHIFSSDGPDYGFGWKPPFSELLRVRKSAK